ncbi:unnamed protein product [Calicophoron daubneyi]|uniref:Uncharacterized protein n=1 Tax=Calicophoron daubneyi TaxID=300641 RepID=A0AAV2T9A8_CALDB
MDQIENVLKAPPDSTNSDLMNPGQEPGDNDSGSAVQSNTSVSTSPSMSKSIPFRDPYLPEDDGSILTPEHAFVQYQTRSEDQACQICGQPAVGFHHRAYVCEACKKFFMRHTTARFRNAEAGGPTPVDSVCPMGGQCRIEGPGRGKCPHCRYRKCLDLGMTLTPPGGESGCDISQIPCRVCGGPSSGFHFGALTCEGCKGFFRRTVLSNVRLECLSNNDCPITPANRNMCKSCRFQRCLAVGMSKTGNRIGRQPNAIKYYCAREISQLNSSADSDGAPTSSALVANGRGQDARQRTVSTSSDGDRGRSPAQQPSRLSSSSCNSGSGQPAHSSTDQISNSHSRGVGGQQFSPSVKAPSNSTGLAKRGDTKSQFPNSAGLSTGSVTPDSSPKLVPTPTKRRKGLSFTQNSAGTISSAMSTNNQRSTNQPPPSFAHCEQDSERLKYASSPSLPVRGSDGIPREWYSALNQAGMEGGNNGDRRSYVISVDPLSQAPTLEYSLPTLDTSSHISSSTPAHDSLVLRQEEEDRTAGNLLVPLAAQPSLDETSEDDVQYALGHVEVLQRREATSTYPYPPSFKDRTHRPVHPYRTQVSDNSPSPPSLVGISIPQPSSSSNDNRNDQNLAQSVTASRTTRSIVDHLTSTVLQFRHQQRLVTSNLDIPSPSDHSPDSNLMALKSSGSPLADLAVNNSSRLRTNSRQSPHSTVTFAESQQQIRLQKQSLSSASPLQQQGLGITSVYVSSGNPARVSAPTSHHSYPLGPSCKPSSPENSWNPKQRYMKSSRSPLNDGQFRLIGLNNNGNSNNNNGIGGSNTNGTKYEPGSLSLNCNGSSVPADVTCTSSAPWLAAAAAAAAVANAIMVASQPPVSTTNVLADPYTVSSSVNTAVGGEVTPDQLDLIAFRRTLPISALCTKIFVTVKDFADGISVAAKYMMSERKNIRNNVTQPCLPMQSLERVEDVWDRMMQHFELHSRFIVHFVKHIPGFNHLELSDKRQLVRSAMYPLMMLELSRDYVNGEQSHYNYFDFTESEREVILKHFPTFRTITEHLIRSGEFLDRIRLDNIELALVCAQEVFKNQQGLIDPVAVEHLYCLASRVLAEHIVSTGHVLEERATLLRGLSPLLDEYNLEHHQVIAQVRHDKPQLEFPELYIEMFQLTEAEQYEQEMAQSQQQQSSEANG